MIGSLHWFYTHYYYSGTHCVLVTVNNTIIIVHLLLCTAAALSNGPPRVPDYALSNIRKSRVSTTVTLLCEAQGYPLPGFRLGFLRVLYLLFKDVDIYHHSFLFNARLNWANQDKKVGY